MAIETSLRAALIADAVVNGLISGRVYPTGSAPKGVVYPFITYSRGGSDTSYYQGGREGTVQANFNMSAWSDSIDGAVTLADAIKDCVSGFMHENMEGTTVEFIEIADEFDGYTQEVDGEDAVDYRRELMLEVHFCE